MQARNIMMIMAVALLGCVTGCVKHAKPQQAIPVSVTAVQLTNAQGADDVYSGNIVPAATVPVAFTVGGYVRQILTMPGSGGVVRLVQQGDRVTKGTILAHVRDTDYLAQVAQADAQVSGKTALTEQALYGKLQASATLDHATAGVNEAMAARDQAQTMLTQAEAGVAAAQSQLTEAQAAVQAAAAQQAQAEAGREKAQADFSRADRLYAAKSLTRADYDAAQAQLRVTEAQVHAAQEQVNVARSKVQQATVQIDANRAKMAQSKAAIAQSEAVISSAKAQQRAAQAAVSGAQAQVEASAAGTRAARAQLTQAHTPLSDSYLKAPLTGVVLQRNIELGALVGQGTPGFVMADDAIVKVVFGVADVTVPQIHLGDCADVVTQAYAQRHYTGIITAISPAADATSHVFQVEVTLRNTDRSLKMGMIAKIKLLRQSNVVPEYPTVPLSSIVPYPGDANAYAVFVVTTAGHGTFRAHIRRVTVEDIVGNAIEVSSGLSTGDLVVTNGATLVRNGDLVAIVE